MDFYLSDERDTLSSALRPVLEERHPNDFVASVRQHPLDTFIRVTAPSEADLRAALLVIKDKIATARKVVANEAPRAPAPPPSEGPVGKRDETSPRRSARVRAAPA